MDLSQCPSVWSVKSETAHRRQQDSYTGMTWESPGGHGIWNGNQDTEESAGVTTLGQEEETGQYQPVMECVPAEVPLVVPVTGESFCECPTQTDLSSHTPTDTHTLECTCGEDDSGCVWVWDEECVSPGVLLSSSNRKVSFHPDYSCGTVAVRGSAELRHGQHFWEIKMTSPVYGTDMMVGIGTAEVNLNQYRHSFCSLLGSDPHSWGLSYTGLLHHKGSKVSFSPRFGQGSIIGLHLDTWHGTLTFYKNRHWIGVAATGLRNKTFYPMVCSTAAKSSMKVIRSVSAPTSLQYLCCSHLRRYLPDAPDCLSTLPLPPGLKLQIAQQLGWVFQLRTPETPHTCEEESQPGHTSHDSPEHNLHDSTFFTPEQVHLTPHPGSTSSTPADTCLITNLDSASFSPVDTYLTTNPVSAPFTPTDTLSPTNPVSAPFSPADTYLTTNLDSNSFTTTDTYLPTISDSASFTPTDTLPPTTPVSAHFSPADTYLTTNPGIHSDSSFIPANPLHTCHPDPASYLDDVVAAYPDSAYCTPVHTLLSSNTDCDSCKDASLYTDLDSFSDPGSCSDSASASCPCCDAPLSLATSLHDDCLSSVSCCSGSASRPASPLPDPSYCSASSLPDPTHSRPSSASGSDSGHCSSDTCQRKRCRWT